MIFKFLRTVFNLNNDFSLPCYDRADESFHIERVNATTYDLTINNGDGTVTIERLVVVSPGRKLRVH